MKTNSLPILNLFVIEHFYVQIHSGFIMLLHRNEKNYGHFNSVYDIIESLSWSEMVLIEIGNVSKTPIPTVSSKLAEILPNFFESSTILKGHLFLSSHSGFLDAEYVSL